MDSELLKTIGQIAGLGGIALGVFLLLFRDVIRKAIFPTLKKDHAYRLLRLMVLLVSGVALAGIGTWAWVETHPRDGTANGPNVEAHHGGVAAGRDIQDSTINTTPGPATQKAQDGK
jgi:hypothetical protein